MSPGGKYCGKLPTVFRVMPPIDRPRQPGARIARATAPHAPRLLGAEKRAPLTRWRQAALTVDLSGGSPDIRSASLDDWTVGYVACVTNARRIWWASAHFSSYTARYTLRHCGTTEQKTGKD